MQARNVHALASTALEPDRTRVVERLARCCHAQVRAATHAMGTQLSLRLRELDVQLGSLDVEEVARSVGVHEGVRHVDVVDPAQAVGRRLLGQALQTLEEGSADPPRHAGLRGGAEQRRAQLLLRRRAGAAAEQAEINPTDESVDHPTTGRAARGLHVVGRVVEWVPEHRLRLLLVQQHSVTRPGRLDVDDSRHPLLLHCAPSPVSNCIGFFKEVEG